MTKSYQKTACWVMVRVTPKRRSLSTWIEDNIILPDYVAEPGPLRLSPSMRAIADAIGDPSIERVSVLKSARIGFSTVLTAAIGYHIVKDPCPVLVLLPTQDDCRDYVMSDVERLFDASPRLRKRLSGPKAGSDRTNRNTLTHRLFKGGDLKVVAGKVPLVLVAVSNFWIRHPATTAPSQNCKIEAGPPSMRLLLLPRFCLRHKSPYLLQIFSVASIVLVSLGF
jgi:phage terminase large subunit GpA-like protein